MGAVGEEGTLVLNPDVIRMAGVSEAELRRAEDREREEVRQRVDRFREGRSPEPLTDRTAVIVDDGIATGATARAACAVGRARGAERVILAASVAAPSALESFAEADEVISVLAPRDFRAVGMHYSDFAQTDDAEVVEILRAAFSS